MNDVIKLKLKISENCIQAVIYERALNTEGTVTYELMVEDTPLTIYVKGDDVMFYSNRKCLDCQLNAVRRWLSKREI